jgi:hypothetical protein
VTAYGGELEGVRVERKRAEGGIERERGEGIRLAVTMSSEVTRM